MFRSYRINGMKIQYRPYFFSATQNDLVLKAINVGTKMDISAAQVVPVPLPEYRAALDARVYDPTKPFKRYYHVRKWASGKEINWRDTSQALTNTYGNATPDCMTCFEMDTVGVANGALMGSVMVTYYV